MKIHFLCKFNIKPLLDTFVNFCLLVFVFLKYILLLCVCVWNKVTTVDYCTLRIKTVSYRTLHTTKVIHRTFFKIKSVKGGNISWDGAVKIPSLTF